MYIPISDLDETKYKKGQRITYSDVSYHPKIQTELPDLDLWGLYKLPLADKGLNYLNYI